MSNTPRVIGIGGSTLDILVRTEKLPTWEEQPRFESIRMDGGGLAATAIAAAARLGLSAGMIATAGNDENADQKKRLTKCYGVDTSRMVRREIAENAVVIVFVDPTTGERAFFGGGRQGENPITPAELDKDYIIAADYLHLDAIHIDAAICAARWMHEAGKTVVLDASTSTGTIWEPRRKLVPYTDILISGSGFAEALTGCDNIKDAGAKILEMGPSVFVQTNGEHGCETITADDSFHTPSFKVDIVDTTGAGDVFHGAYIVGLARGWNLREIAQFSSAVSAINCTKLGGRSGVPSFDEVITFLKAQNITLKT